MAAFYNFVFLILLSPMTNVRGVANNIPLQRRTRTTVNSFTDVVSHAFCDSSLQAEEKIAKKSLEEVHTFAELKHDPRASLPDLFSICSTIMTPSCRSDIWPTIFTILGNEQTQFLAAICLSGAIIGETPLLFPNQWTRNCMAVNTTSMTGFEQKTGFGCEVKRRRLVCTESQGDKCELILICLVD